MMRRLMLAVAAMGALVPCSEVLGARRNALISQPLARVHGMTRAWYTQVRLDQARARVRHVVLHQGTLFVQTDHGVLHAINAETGETLWAEQVGRPDHPSLVPGVNSNLVAVVNGSNVFVLNRHNGKLLWKTPLDGAPGAGAELSERRAYIPTVGGLIYSFELEPAKDPMAELGARKKRDLTPEEAAEDKADRIESLRLSQEYVPPLACQSLGRSLVQPLFTRQAAYREYVAWPTDAGHLFIGMVDQREERFTIKYRLSTDAGIAARPSYLPPDPEITGDSGVIYAASRDGYVHAILEKTGDALWRFSTGEPLLESVAVVEKSVYVATQPGGMYCLDAKSGAERWWTPSVAQFVAASKDRIYVADKLQRIVVLSAKTGTRLDSIDGTAWPVKLRNTETDRIYVATANGLVQCLHEIELTKPIRHGVKIKAEKPKDVVQQEGLEPGGPEGPAAKPKPDDPIFAPAKPGDDTPAKPGDDPFR